ncbi:hypothetical protein F5J12DRAFT_786643 [Pisolithus orientalis]|uniref:uncharacterized protein n=1 Tax=Pisolithus orientalis TaxID=936130 RepID=UPI002225053D|nr:uncharacterized protein F5J12DRAFT_786643 [Pisolithus orientalis]KAI5989627.1 hypothetical protein F5J12DRAFT_786643 [Pisolithus orientalis]
MSSFHLSLIIPYEMVVTNEQLSTLQFCLLFLKFHLTPQPQYSTTFKWYCFIYLFLLKDKLTLGRLHHWSHWSSHHFQFGTQHYSRVLASPAFAGIVDLSDFADIMMLGLLCIYSLALGVGAGHACGLAFPSEQMKEHHWLILGTISPLSHLALKIAIPFYHMLEQAKHVPDCNCKILLCSWIVIGMGGHNTDAGFAVCHILFHDNKQVSFHRTVLGTYLIDYLTVRTTMVVGSFLQAILGLTIGMYTPLTNHIAAFAVVYGIFLTLGEVGAIGKVGALIGTWVFSQIIDGQYWSILDW